MTGDLHERARNLVALAGSEEAGNVDRAWLQSHLADCERCRAYANRTQEVVAALRSIPVAAGSALVAATQMRVRTRAQELRRRPERVWFVATSCVLVSISAGFGTMLAWRGWEWLGEQFQISSLAWQVSFGLVWITPVLICSLVLLANGTHLADHSGSWQG